jgi:uncharacterized membrane protein HdeD (DUF308 family)
MTAATRLSDDVQATVLHKMWWAVLLRAIAITAFALLAFFRMGHSLPGLTQLFAIYALADGLISIAGAVRGGGLTSRAGLALGGAASLAASGAAFFWSGITWEAFATLIAIWAVVRGALEFISALVLRRYMERDWSLALIGMLSIMFGVGVFLRVGFEPWTFVRLLSCYALVIGLLLFVLAVRFLRGFRA